MGCGVAKHGNNTVIFCGPGVVQCARCVGVALFLCDYPTGKGKTCDLPLCEEHARELGHELHVCPLHSLAFDEQRFEQLGWKLRPLVAGEEPTK